MTWLGAESVLRRFQIRVFFDGKGCLIERENMLVEENDSAVSI